jgi:malto-oligosyltrehalose trehalohydrolase
VVYNHFGPTGNYLGLYSPEFFTDRYSTPWGAAINFDGEGARWVRQYFIHNALYWLEEYRFDGLRLDAVHAIMDRSARHVLDELAHTVNSTLGTQRHIHLVLENDANQPGFLGRGKYTAQWNDDSHHGYHVLATGETDGYYAAYADAPAKHLARCLAEGFAYQGEVSPFTNERRGAPSKHLAPRCFVDFMQNHDQIGNRALGERLLALSDDNIVKSLAAILLLAPSPPLLFMGEEWGCRQPFHFFCDFAGELGEAVRNGRREEFKRFAAFVLPEARERIPDPLDEATFRQCVLRWEDMDGEWLRFYRELLALRKTEIAPRIFRPGRYAMAGERAFEVSWPIEGEGALRLLANCGGPPVRQEREGRTLWSRGDPGGPWSVSWCLK